MAPTWMATPPSTPLTSGPMMARCTRCADEVAAAAGPGLPLHMDEHAWHQLCNVYVLLMQLMNSWEYG